jgi:DNA-binding response OmpR family regulator
MVDHCDEILPCCPCLVLAHADAAYAAAVSRALRLRGWDVYTARSGPEARRLARMLAADLVILGAELAGESGFLTCAKLVGELPMVPVLLVAAGARARRLASFVGAGDCIDRSAGMPALLWQVEAAGVAAAG